MSGPNDSGAGGTANQDFVLPIFRTGPQPPSERFRLKLFPEPLRLDWIPKTVLPGPPGEPAFLKLDRPLDALASYRDYLAGGGLQADLARARFDLLDKAFLQAPVDPPRLLPTFAEMKAWEDDAFYKAHGRSPPLFGAPAPIQLLSPPLSGPKPPSSFYALPDPGAMRGEPPAPRAGAAGDVLKAVLKLPAVKRKYDDLQTLGMDQVNLLSREWDKAPWKDRITAIVLFAPLPAELVRGILGNDEARRFAFNAVRGKEIPIPFVPALKLRIDGLGRANPFFFGPKAGDPEEFKVFLLLDVLEAFPSFAKKINPPPPAALF